MRFFMILDKIHDSKDLRALSREELPPLAEEVRREIIEVVSKTGGHLASSLGVVDLTIALHYAFDTPKDRIVWDVGHQAYAHKILTGRRSQFPTLRQHGGISGFPKRDESPFDHFDVGHASTSISAALGMVAARDIKGEDFKVIAVIGDGSISAGLAFEGLNQAGHLKKNLIVILNDNEMSISKNVGALSAFISRKMTANYYRDLKKEMQGLLANIPAVGHNILRFARRAENSLKGFLTPGALFEALNFEYIGPLQGHNLPQLLEVLKNVRSLEGPVLVHVMTTKGKGYPPAENNPAQFHGVGPFDITTA